jgi:hypothetical protein
VTARVVGEGADGWPCWYQFTDIGKGCRCDLNRGHDGMHQCWDAEHAAMAGIAVPKSAWDEINDRLEAAEAQLVEERAHFSAIHEVDLARSSAAEARAEALDDDAVRASRAWEVERRGLTERAGRWRARAEAAESRLEAVNALCLDSEDAISPNDPKVWHIVEYMEGWDAAVDACRSLVRAAMPSPVMHINIHAAPSPQPEPPVDVTRLIDPELAHGRESSEKEMRELRADLAAERDLP